MSIALCLLTSISLYAHQPEKKVLNDLDACTYSKPYCDSCYTIIPLKQKIEKKTKSIEPAEERGTKFWHLAIKTNGLFDAILIPNLGIEMGIGNHVSVAADWHYAWWSRNHSHHYWQSYGGYLTARYWFGQRHKDECSIPLHGHHVGIYGLMITHDFEWGKRGYQAADWCFGGGLEYGYSMPLSRRFNLDFIIGLGYLDGTYKEYLPMDGHYVWQATKRRHWWGPTKAEVTFVWLLDSDIHNRRKNGGHK